MSLDSTDLNSSSKDNCIQATITIKKIISILES